MKLLYKFKFLVVDILGRLILNADDPIVVNFRTKRNLKPIYFGFDSIEFMDKNIESKAPMELFNCAQCGKVLKYIKRFYAQQGHYYCLNQFYYFV